MFEPIKAIGASGIKPIDMSFTREASKKESTEGFGSLFSKAFSDANKAMFYAGQTGRIVAAGGNIEMHEVSIAGQKAKIALHLTTQLTGKITQACQQLFQMQL
ncbi:MAG: flagellar hook-basal body protein FliE [bacterium ADurb.Bin363]|nr:MAG: flagellar hook-basal body protein FliE [bacterium ADurb.Bin363]